MKRITTSDKWLFSLWGTCVALWVLLWIFWQNEAYRVPLTIVLLVVSVIQTLVVTWQTTRKNKLGNDREI
jgi:hypothetical protein